MRLFVGVGGGVGAVAFVWLAIGDRGGGGGLLLPVSGTTEKKVELG